MTVNQVLSTLLLKSSFGSLFVMSFGAASSLLLQVYLARMLGVHDYGVYVYVLSWIGVLTVLVTFGFDSTLIRFVPAYSAGDDQSSLRQLVDFSNGWVWITGILLSVATSLIAYHSLWEQSGSYALVFCISSILLPLTGLARIRSSILRGLKLAVHSYIPEAIVRPVLFFILLSLTFQVLGIGRNAVSAMALNVISAMLTLLVSSYMVEMRLPALKARVAEKSQLIEWLRVSLPLFLMAALTLVLQQLDTLMIGALIGSSDAGVYSVSSRLSSLIVFGLTAVNGIVAPLISHYYVTRDLFSMSKLVVQATRGVFLFSLVVAGFIWTFGEWALQLFGGEFLKGEGALKILLFGQLVNASCGSVGFLMTMTNHQNAAVVILAFAFVLNFLLNFWLIPVFGLSGAAFSTTASMVFWNVSMVIFVYKKLGINSSVFGVTKSYGA